jgi:hypothetical protein
VIAFGSSDAFGSGPVVRSGEITSEVRAPLTDAYPKAASRGLATWKVWRRSRVRVLVDRTPAAVGLGALGLARRGAQGDRIVCLIACLITRRSEDGATGAGRVRAVATVL